MAFLKDRDNLGQDLVINGQRFQHSIYVHPDGSMVKAKPDGDPQNPIPCRRIPNVYKCVQLTIGPDTSFANEAFRLNEEGNPVPKTPTEMNQPYPAGTRESEAWINSIADSVVTPLEEQ